MTKQKGSGTPGSFLIKGISVGTHDREAFVEDEPQMSATWLIMAIGTEVNLDMTTSKSKMISLFRVTA